MTQPSLPSPADILPHRPPFLFVDTITRLEAGQAAAGTWTLQGDEWFFPGHQHLTPLVCRSAYSLSANAWSLEL